MLVAVSAGWGSCVLEWLFWVLSAAGVRTFAWGVFAVPDVPTLEDDGAAAGADDVGVPLRGRLTTRPDRIKMMPSAAAIVLIKRVEYRRYVGHVLLRPRVMCFTGARTSGREICPTGDVIVSGNTKERGNSGCGSACSNSDVCRRSAIIPWHCWQARRCAWQTAHSCGGSCLSSIAESCSIVRCPLNCRATPILRYGIEKFPVFVQVAAQPRPPACDT